MSWICHLSILTLPYARATIAEISQAVKIPDLNIECNCIGIIRSVKILFSRYNFRCLHFTNVNLFEVSVLEIFLLSYSNQAPLLHDAHTVCYHFGAEYIMGGY